MASPSRPASDRKPARPAAGGDKPTAQAASDPRPPFAARWLFSTNHKDIGTLYLVLSATAGILGTGLSVAMRMELQEPGLQFFTDPEIYNVLASSHGLVMIFFVIMPA